MSETKLKPCPFCGGEAEIYKETPPDAYKDTVYYVGCSNIDECLVVPETMGYHDKQKAIAAWNKRAEDQNNIPT